MNDLPAPCTHTDNCGCTDVHSYVDYYTRLVQWIRPAKVFEWGPGPNTAIALKAGAVVASVEQEKRWIPDKLDKNQIVLNIRTDSPLYVAMPGYEDADIVFVDSRHRAACLDYAREHCRPDAVVCLHDATRQRYRAAVERFAYIHFDTPGFACMTMDANVYRRLLEI